MWITQLNMDLRGKKRRNGKDKNRTRWYGKTGNIRSKKTVIEENDREEKKEDEINHMFALMMREIKKINEIMVKKMCENRRKYNERRKHKRVVDREEIIKKIDGMDKKLNRMDKKFIEWTKN